MALKTLARCVIDKPWLDELDEDSECHFECDVFLGVLLVEIVDGDIFLHANSYWLIMVDY